MLAWMRENVDLLNLVANLGMLGVWLLYLQLFYQSYRRQRKPNLLVHQANGFDLDSMCLIANMSESHVHVAAVLVDAKRDDVVVSFRPSPSVPDPFERDDPLRKVHEGPLAQGAYMSLGSFRALVAEATARLPEEEAPALELAVRIVAFVGPELHPVGARRTFMVAPGEDGAEVRPQHTIPEQLATRRQRRVASAWLEEARAMDPSDVVSYEEEERSLERLLEREASGETAREPRDPPVPGRVREPDGD